MRLLGLLGLLTIALHGCAAVALPAVGAAVLTSSAGAAARAGTEYTLRGTAYRTFTRPLAEVRGAALQTLDGADVTIIANESTDRGSRIRAEATRRTINVTLERLAPSLTRMRLPPPARSSRRRPRGWPECRRRWPRPPTAETVARGAGQGRSQRAGPPATGLSRARPSRASLRRCDSTDMAAAGCSAGDTSA